MLSNPKQNISLLCALLAFALAGCGVHQVQTVPQVSSSRASSTTVRLAVAGDSPLEMNDAVVAAGHQHKPVSYVTVTRNGKRDVYPVFAQILRSDNALLVRAYGKLYAYPLTGLTVKVEPNPTSVAIESLPAVSVPQIDADVQGAATNARAGLRGCLACVGVLGHRRAEATTWNDAKDPWQVDVTYTFWKPGTDVLVAQAETRITPECQSPMITTRSHGSRSMQPACSKFNGSYSSSYNSGMNFPPYYTSYSCSDCAKLAPARYNYTAEAACRQQGGRYADIWSYGDFFYCVHVNDSSAFAIYDEYAGCEIKVVLPSYAKGAIAVTISSQSLTPSASTNAVGVRADLTRCYWKSGN